MTKLTNEQIASLTGQALADAMAERVMGWTRLRPRCIAGRDVWSNSNGRLKVFCDEWHPNSDHNDAARVMARMQELGQLDRWIHFLLPTDHGDGFHELRTVLRSSPTDRCRAALMAVEREQPE